MCVGNVSQSERFEGPFRTIDKVPVSQVETIPVNSKVLQDVIATLNHSSKDLQNLLRNWKRTFQNSTYYKILFQTTQPAHVITAISVIMLSLMLVPTENRSSLKSPLWSLIYLGSFSAHFGAQLWMTFVSGLSLYFALPRHHFGNVQKVLFPRYFLFNSILSLITLYVFLRTHKNQFNSTIISQVVAMTLCFLIELLIRLYLTPPLLSLITIKTKIEAKAGVGMEVGKVQPGTLLKCPHYVAIHKTFRKVHMTIAMGNIITMACTIFHLYYISQKLCAL